MWQILFIINKQQYDIVFDSTDEQNKFTTASELMENRQHSNVTTYHKNDKHIFHYNTNGCDLQVWRK